VKRELNRQIAMLMICRAVLLTALLVSGLVIGRLFQQPLLASKHFYLLTGLGYALTIVYALLHPLWSRHVSAACVQLAGDVALITGIVYVTGGIDSPFSLLYFLPVIAGGIMLGRAGAMVSAAGAWAVYAFLVVLIVYGVVPNLAADQWHAGLTPAAIDKRVAFSLFSHFLGFFVVAYLSSYLALKLEAAGDQLEENREVLAKVQALNKNIVDSITSGIITTDLEGRITFMNRGAQEITGRSLPQVEGAGIAAFLTREEGFFEMIRASIGRERRFRFESPIVRDNGRLRYLGMSATTLRDQRGEPRGYIFSFQDLTEIKALEEEVRLKDHMAALGEMAAGIAHEIRNPLASMSGSVQILKKSLQPEGEEGELLDIVLRESKRLDGIIRDFLLFTKPGRFSAEPADVVPVLRDALTLLRNSPEFTPKHSIVTRLEGEGVGALVDVNMIKQVFWNLAKNSLKAMPDGGTLTVGAWRENDSTIGVSFADDGTGMTEEEIARAFEPFHGSFRDGTGLGLAVVFRIVQEHGGRIRIRSRVGAGTEVIVALPGATLARQSGGVSGMAAAGAST